LKKVLENPKNFERNGFSKFSVALLTAFSPYPSRQLPLSRPARLFRRALPRTPLKDFLKKVLENPKNFERNASLISE